MAKTTEQTAVKTAIVIGAGAGGVAIAARLAKAGLAVTVVEKNGFTGGRCSLARTPAGFRFDTGPSLLLMPELFAETFTDLTGTPPPSSLEAAGVELLPCHPNYHVWFADGACFRAGTDTALMRREIERWEGAAGFRRYLGWLAEAHTHYELSLRHVLHRNFASLADMARPSFLRAGLLALHPFESVWSRASRYFWTDRLRRVFTFATMYMGMSPFDAPATYSLLQYAELARGIWYPRGGFHAVLDALVRIGTEMGVEYKLDTSVEQITVADAADAGTTAMPTAGGVRLATGETLMADVVVVNADLVYAYNNLFPLSADTAAAAYARSLKARKTSCSSISFYWSLTRRVPELGAHNIFLAEAYRESFDAIFSSDSSVESGGMPDEPSFYVHVPSRVDPGAAPDGCDAVVVLVPVGHLSQEPDSDSPRRQQPDWPGVVSRARAAVLSTIEARTGCASLAPLICEERVRTPSDWAADFHLDRGAILGLRHGLFEVMAFRPSTRAKGLRNTYFVGASTHPGTGVPVVLAGAKITAEQILGDLGMAVPWQSNREMQLQAEAGQDGTAGTKSTGSLDQVRRPRWMSDTNTLTAVGIVLVLVLLVFSGIAGDSGLGFVNKAANWYLGRTDERTQ